MGGTSKHQFYTFSFWIKSTKFAECTHFILNLFEHGDGTDRDVHSKFDTEQVLVIDTLDKSRYLSNNEKRQL